MTWNPGTKRALGAFGVAAAALTLSACVVLPVPHAHGRGTVVVERGWHGGPPPPPRHWEHSRRDSRYDGRRDGRYDGRDGRRD